MNASKYTSKYINKLFLRCCFGYMASGMSVLAIGAVLPYLIKEAGISYAAAGGLLSFMAIGNFMASFLFPILVRYLGRRFSIAVTSAFVPVSLLLLTFLPSVTVMYALMFFFGIARGCITILNNQTVNDISVNPSRMLNLLHCSFAVGAFLAPFLTALCIQAGLGWRSAIYFLLALNVISFCSYSATSYPAPSAPDSDAGQRGSQEEKTRFLKSFDFYCICMLLFFYLGLENCINGWFVTYLQSTGVISEAFSNSLVSVTWVVIMAGRILCSVVSGKIKKEVLIFSCCTGSALFFFLLIQANSLPVITIALAGLGFCLSGIYPTSVADAGRLIQGSTLGMSMLTAISSLGGIIAPQIVGGVADRMGIVQAVNFLVINVGVMILLSYINYRRGKRLLM